MIHDYDPHANAIARAMIRRAATLRSDLPALRFVRRPANRYLAPLPTYPGTVPALASFGGLQVTCPTVPCTGPLDTPVRACLLPTPNRYNTRTALQSEPGDRRPPLRYPVRIPRRGRHRRGRNDTSHRLVRRAPRQETRVRTRVRRRPLNRKCTPSRAQPRRLGMPKLVSFRQRCGRAQKLSVWYNTYLGW